MTSSWSRRTASGGSTTRRRGLMVAEYSFRPFYQAYDLYFVGNGISLVPDPIYLPSLRSPQNVASALITALLSGPSALAGAGRHHGDPDRHHAERRAR